MEKLLTGLGLTRNEAKVYLALLKRRMRLKEITEATGLHNANALRALEGLKQKGMASERLEGKRRQYIAADPPRLKVVLEEREKKLEELLPELLSMKESSDRPTVEIFSGKGGIKTILKDEIAVGKTLHVIQSSETAEAMAGGYLPISREQRWRAGIRMKIIYSEKDRKYGGRAAKYPKTSVKYLPEDFGSTTIDTYGNRTVLVFGKEPTIIRIIDEGVARRFRQFFDLSWGRAKKL